MSENDNTRITDIIIARLENIERKIVAMQSNWCSKADGHTRMQAGASELFRRVTHAGQTWQSTVDANVWAPGVYGWTRL